MIDRVDERETPFAGTIVYYSGSIQGLPEIDPNFAWELVTYMETNGSNILDKHVAARNSEERSALWSRSIGVDIEVLKSEPEPEHSIRIREQDIAWVDESTHVVSLVNAPSHGVGMEVQRALDFVEFGIQPNKQILCLVHKSLLPTNKLSAMIRGIDPQKHPTCYVRSYSSLEDAKGIIESFLTGTIVHQQN